MNTLICGDNLKALDDLIKEGVKVDLIYLDPPFFSNRHYEVIWGDEAEVRSFKDRWAGGISVYIEWMRERISKMYEVLKDTGSFYLHCDWHASHYLKIMCDDIFGHRKFQNEIVWKRVSAHNDPKKWGRVHDTILFYVKSDIYTWNPIFTEYDPAYLEMFLDSTDEKGVRYKRSDLTGAGPSQGDSGKPWRDINVTSKGRHWSTPDAMIERLAGKKVAATLTTQEKLDLLDKNHRIHWPEKKDGMPRLKQFIEDLPGIPLQDVINDIRPLHNLAAERLGFPTQKPEPLLERIIKASSNKGDITLDPFCGCGTCNVVSEKLGRKWIGIDISPTAIKLIEKRLSNLGVVKGKDYEIIGMPTTLSELKKLESFEFQNWVINEMKAKQSKKLTADFGLDGYYDKTIFTERAGIQVKQSEGIGRNVVDNFETALTRGKFKKGFIVAFGFTKGAYEEAARIKGDLDISLIKVEDLLLGKVKI